MYTIHCTMYSLQYKNGCILGFDSAPSERFSVRVGFKAEVLSWCEIRVEYKGLVSIDKHFVECKVEGIVDSSV